MLEKLSPDIDFVQPLPLVPRIVQVKKVPKWKRINVSRTDAQAKQGKNKNMGHFLILCTRVFLYVPVRYSFVNLDFLGSQMALA